MKKLISLIFIIICYVNCLDLQVKFEETSMMIKIKSNNLQLIDIKHRSNLPLTDYEYKMLKQYPIQLKELEQELLEIEQKLNLKCKKH